MAKFNYLEIPEFALTDSPTVEQVTVKMMFLHLTIDHGLTQYEACEALGIDKDTMSHLLDRGYGSGS